jgi:hypothetical protein
MISNMMQQMQHSHAFGCGRDGSQLTGYNSRRRWSSAAAQQLQRSRMYLIELSCGQLQEIQQAHALLLLLVCLAEHQCAASSSVPAACLLTGQVSHAVSSRLQQAGIQLPANPGQQQLIVGDSSSSSSGTLQGPYFQQQPGLQLQLQPQQGTAAAAFDISGMLGGTGGYSSTNSSSSSPAGVGTGRAGSAGSAVWQANDFNFAYQQQLGGTVSSPIPQQQQQQDPVVMQTLLMQHQEIEQLQKQNRQLRAAVCKLDSSAAVCSSRDGSSRSSSTGRRSARSRLKGASSSDDVWSA